MEKSSCDDCWMQYRNTTKYPTRTEKGSSFFEKNALQYLSKLYPHYKKQIDSILNRFIDISIPFKHYYIYSYKTRGNFSMKNLIETLYPNFSFSNLVISNGELAAKTYLELIYEKSTLKQTKILKDLEDYCHHDTLSLTKLLDYLKSLNTFS